MVDFGASQLVPSVDLSDNWIHGFVASRHVAIQAPVLNYEQAVQRISGCESQVRALGVTRLALFGSVLRGDARPHSDVDRLVQFAPGAKSYDRFLALSELLEAHLGRPVELVTLEALSPLIGPRILRRRSRCPSSRVTTFATS